jgi:Tol biopolymer transport system component
MFRWMLKITLISAAIAASLITVSIAAGWTMRGGGQLAYEARWRGDIDIYLVDITRGITQNLTRHQGTDTRPVWSPDGRYIAFESTRFNQIKIFVMDSLGRQVRSLLPLDWDYPTFQNNPMWSIDGQSVFFQSYFSRNAPTFRIDLDGNNFTRVVPGEAVNIARVNSDSDRLLVTSYRNGTWGIYLYSSDWREMRQLTNNNVRFRDPPRWSPTAQEVAFVSSGLGETEIYVMNADGSNLRRITHDGLIKTNLNWRPQ